MAALLAWHDRASGFLETPAGVLLGDCTSGHASADPAVDPNIGRVIGSYRIESRIGHGGMGTVYRAVRDDDAFRKTVALKLVRGGRYSEYFERRFLLERKILAGLQHPNIAIVLDGGTTDTGHPYLVMEYVEGQPPRVAGRIHDRASAIALCRSGEGLCPRHNQGRLRRRVKNGVYGLGGVRLWNSDISCNSSPSGYRPVSRCT